MYFQLVSLIWARQCTLPPVPVVGRLYAQDKVEAGYPCLPGREVCSRMLTTGRKAIFLMYSTQHRSIFNNSH